MCLPVDSYWASLNKHGEEVCGNLVEVISGDAGLTALMADGEGDGTGASITASFVIRMALSLLKSGERPKEIIRTISDIYPDMNMPGLAIVQIAQSGAAEVASVNMPAPVVLHKGRQQPFACVCPQQGGKTARFASFTARKGMAVIQFSHGLLLAGADQGARWQLPDVEQYIRSAYRPLNITARRMTELLLTAAESLEMGRPAHDISVLTLRLTDKLR